MRIILIDGFDMDFIKDVPFLLDLKHKSIFAKVRNFPNTDYLDIIKDSKQEIEFIHIREIDKYAHYQFSKLKEGLRNLNQKLIKLCREKEFIILADHGNKELSKKDKKLTGLFYGHDYFPTSSPLFIKLEKQAPKNLGEVTGVEAQGFLRMLLK